jgi:hypothetical protein
MPREMACVTVFYSYIVLLSMCLRSNIPAVNGRELSPIVSKICAEYFTGLLKVEWGEKENLSNERYSVAVCNTTSWLVDWVICTWGTYVMCFYLEGSQYYHLSEPWPSSDIPNQNTALLELDLLPSSVGGGGGGGGGCGGGLCAQLEPIKRDNNSYYWTYPVCYRV